MKLGDMIKRDNAASRQNLVKKEWGGVFPSTSAALSPHACLWDAAEGSGSPEGL